MKLSILVPCYNEVNTITTVINSIRSSPVEDQEIIIIDDASSDGTEELLKTDTFKGVKVVTHSVNKGKGASIRTGLKYVTGSIVIIQDADLEYDPNEYPNMIQPILDNKADVVFGSRFQNGRPHRVVYFWHMVGNSFLTLISNIFTDLNLTDMETGYKAFKANIFNSIELEEDRFSFEPEITAKVAKMKLKIFETGISYNGRLYSEGKKIGWKDGVHAIYSILKYNLFSN